LTATDLDVEICKNSSKHKAFSEVYFSGEAYNVTVWEWIVLTAARTNWNFVFTRTEKILNAEFKNYLKKSLFIINGFYYSRNIFDV